ncbi:MAG: AzlD domain-containing protein [Lachnospiraceae bacterium]|nr:AzlD domain-containing protein [Lachnospiraceae bacterium]
MQSRSIIIYMIIMAAVTYLIRVLPLTLIRKEIKNTFIRSFLYYVPYVTLAVMTFPAIINATESPIAAFISFVVAMMLAWMGASLFKVAVVACVVVFVIELLPFI